MNIQSNKQDQRRKLRYLAIQNQYLIKNLKKSSILLFFKTVKIGNFTLYLLINIFNNLDNYINLSQQMLQQKKKQFTISNKTKEKVQSAKMYIERRYTKLIQQERQKKQNWELLYKKMQTLNLTQNQQQKLKSTILHKEAERLRAYRKRNNIDNYQCIKTIGKGAFGQVRLCRQKESNQPVAIKKMIKNQMINKNKVFQARQEKDILANSQNNKWIVDLKCSFQDLNNLYLVMEYLPGGDLMNLLIKRDIFTQDQARFYIAQMILALDSVHKLHYIHRDIKPDNILIDKDGHIKLSDFGLCKYNEIRPKKLVQQQQPPKIQQSATKKRNQMKSPTKQSKKKNRKLAYSAVGTPDYVAPQVQNKSGYTETVDWWSLGVILYQMLVGYPPFVSEDSRVTWHKIQNWKKFLLIPKEANLSAQATDLIKKLITDQKQRLGNNGVQQIKNHKFFNGIDWKNIKNRSAPNIPQLINGFDTQNFDQFHEGDQWNNQVSKSDKKVRKDVMFIGYTFKKNDSQQSELLKALLDLESCSKLQADKKHSIQIGTNNVDITQQEHNKLFKKQKGAEFWKKDASHQLINSTSTTSTHKNSLRVQIQKKNDNFKYNSPKHINTKQKQLLSSKQSPNNNIIKQQNSKKVVNLKVTTLLRNNLSPQTKKK